MSARTNARDEWRAAALASRGNLATACGALAVARARCNHAAAEGVSYA
jgi:regulator of protease activity HflC (stomatin/prohibitin superfamily)